MILTVVEITFSCNDVSYNHQRKVLFTAHLDGEMRVWNTDGDMVNHARLSAPLKSIDLSPDGNYVLLSDNNTLTEIDIRTFAVSKVRTLYHCDFL